MNTVATRRWRKCISPWIGGSVSTQTTLSAFRGCSVAFCLILCYCRVNPRWGRFTTCWKHIDTAFTVDAPLLGHSSWRFSNRHEPPSEPTMCERALATHPAMDPWFKHYLDNGLGYQKWCNDFYIVYRHLLISLTELINTRAGGNVSLFILKPMDSFGTWRKWKFIFFLLMQIFCCWVIWTINALLTIRSKMLQFSGNYQNINKLGVPPNTLPSRLCTDNLPLGNIALHYVIQNNCRKVWWCFFYDFLHFLKIKPKNNWIHQNYLVALGSKVVLLNSQNHNQTSIHFTYM